MQENQEKKRGHCQFCFFWDSHAMTKYALSSLNPFFTKALSIHVKDQTIFKFYLPTYCKEFDVLVTDEIKMLVVYLC